MNDARQLRYRQTDRQAKTMTEVWSLARIKEWISWEDRLRQLDRGGMVVYKPERESDSQQVCRCVNVFPGHSRVCCDDSSGGRQAEDYSLCGWLQRDRQNEREIVNCQGVYVCVCVCWIKLRCLPWRCFCQGLLNRVTTIEIANRQTNLIIQLNTRILREYGTLCSPRERECVCVSDRRHNWTWWMARGTDVGRRRTKRQS